MSAQNQGEIFLHETQAKTILSVGIDMPGRVGYYGYTERELGQGEFDVETLYSGISAGTELTFFRGSNPYQHKRWESSLRAFVPDVAKDRAIEPEKFIGYMEVGRVTDSQSDLIMPGTVVCMAYGHKTAQRARETDMFIPLPEGVDPILGIFVAQMGPICANALAHADLFLGSRSLVQPLGAGLEGKGVVVFGAGVVGLVTALLAQQSGAQVVVVDRLAGRLARAEKMGLVTLNSGAQDVKQAIKHDLWPNREGEPGADVVIECTGNYCALNDAIAVTRRQGNVLALGFYQGEARGMLLGEEFHHNGIRLICVQIGNTLPGWSHAELAKEMARRIEDPRFQAGLKQLITHRVPFSAAQCAYDALSMNRPDLIREFACDPASQDIVQIVLYPDRAVYQMQ